MDEANPIAFKPETAAGGISISTRKKLEAGARLAIYGVLVNCVLAAVKIEAGMIGHSYALIADGIESTLDIFSSLVIWGGLTLAARPPDATHPYGHGKAEPLAAIAVSLLIIAAAIGLAAESVREILTPHHAPAPIHARRPRRWSWCSRNGSSAAS